MKLCALLLFNECLTGDEVLSRFLHGVRNCKRLLVCDVVLPKVACRYSCKFNGATVKKVSEHYKKLIGFHCCLIGSNGDRDWWQEKGLSETMNYDRRHLIDRVRGLCLNLTGNSGVSLVQSECWIKHWQHCRKSMSCFQYTVCLKKCITGAKYKSIYLFIVFF